MNSLLTLDIKIGGFEKIKLIEDKVEIGEGLDAYMGDDADILRDQFTVETYSSEQEPSGK